MMSKLNYVKIELTNKEYLLLRTALLESNPCLGCCLAEELSKNNSLNAKYKYDKECSSKCDLNKLKSKIINLEE